MAIGKVNLDEKTKRRIRAAHRRGLNAEQIAAQFVKYGVEKGNAAAFKAREERRLKRRPDLAVSFMGDNQLGMWTGWKRQHWPWSSITPGVRLYGFDKRSRTFAYLVEVTKGGGFLYHTMAEFTKEVRRRTGWDPRSDPHWNNVARPTAGEECFGLAVRWKFIAAGIDQPFSGRFPRLGWLRLSHAEAPDGDMGDLRPEGNRRLAKHVRIERSSTLRNRARVFWQRKLGGRLYCLACRFDFGRRYPSHGENWIEMHHDKPLGTNPGLKGYLDLKPLCSNCHRMVHRKRHEPLTLRELRRLLRRGRA